MSKKENYKCPNIEDREGYTAPTSRHAPSDHERVCDLLDETIAAVVMAETYPLETDNKLAKKFKKEEEKNEK